jgi:protein-disulfide isomerase
MVKRCPALAALTGAAIAGVCPALATPPADPGADVVARVGGEYLTEPEVVASHAEAFDKLQRERAERLSAFEHEYARAHHELLANALDADLNERALALEAAARKLPPAALLASVKVPAVSDEDVRAFYEARKSATNESFEQLAPQIRQYLIAQHSETAMQAFYAELRNKYGIVSLLPPYRVAVDPTGPYRGSASARVTIIEFGDFQCPYCRKVEDSLRVVLEKYPSEVRLVFRNLPLSDLHPDALVAARAGVCANQQGKFWEMHDAMFQDQSALGSDRLMATARRIGLEAASFSHCLTDPTVTEPVLSVDARAAAELGIGGTPYFFIDGRPLSGSASPDQFERIIDEELARARHAS